MRRENQRPASGIRLGLTNNIMTLLAVVASALLLIASQRTISGYNDLKRATEQYIVCQQDAALFQAGSDYLTDECRYFAVTGDVAHAINYMEEVETTRRREAAVEELGGFLAGDASYAYLAEGLEISEALAETERYAMRLAAVGYGISPESLPEGIGGLEITEMDAAMVSADKRDRAIELLFGAEYQSAKAAIYECVDRSIRALVDDTRAQQLASSETLRRQLTRQRALISLLLVMLFCVVMATWALVIRPLHICAAHIRGKREIPLTGSREIRFMAQAYNDMFVQNARSTEELTYSATHDSLTGVYNRTAFDAEYRRIDPDKVGVIIIDVDKFKGINDTYGHDVGDRVLKRVAKTISESFRSEDFVSRIGGDEFCVIMQRANSGMQALVAEKIARANRLLAQGEDGLPAISLSVGVAFGDRENPAADIFKDADTALYSVKRTGGGGCAFH